MIDHAKLTKDVKQEAADWSAKKYFHGGVDAADMMTVLVGPIKAAPKLMTQVTDTIDLSSDAFNPKSVPQFVAGLLDALVEESNLTEIEACYDGAHALEKDLAKAIKAAEGHEWKSSVEDLYAFASAVPAELTTCKNLVSDVGSIKTWAKIFSSKFVLAETIAKNLLLHHKKITTDIKAVGHDWSAQQFFEAGKAAGDALIIAVGPVKHTKNLAFLQ